MECQPRLEHPQHNAGDEIFNLLFILGASALLASEGVSVNRVALFFDLPVMAGAALACLSSSPTTASSAAAARLPLRSFTWPT
jgi:hypothetical protein